VVTVSDEYPIPTSVEIVELLQRAGAPYILGYQILLQMLISILLREARL
jgi:hypothetical protein